MQILFHCRMVLILSFLLLLLLLLFVDVCIVIIEHTVKVQTKQDPQCNPDGSSQYREKQV